MNELGLPVVGPCPNQDIQDDARLSDVDGMGVFVRTSATLTQPLYTFGKIKHGREAAEAGVRAYRSLLQIASRRFDEVAAQAYYGLALTKRAQRVFKKGKRYFKKLRKQIERELKGESGKYTSNDLRKLGIKQSDLGVASAEVDYQRRRAIEGIILSCRLDPVRDQIALKNARLKPLKGELKSRETSERTSGQDLSSSSAAAARRERALISLARAKFFPDLALVGTLARERDICEDNPDPFPSRLMLRLWRLPWFEMALELRSAELEFTSSEAAVAG